MSSQMKPNAATNDTAPWDSRRGFIRSRQGGWVVGEAIYNRGYSMMDDLVGRASYFQVLMLNVTGRLPDRRLAEWMEAMFICLSWPDARIWCNQVGSLAGALRSSPVAAVSGGILASDSHLYGPGTVVAAAHFFIRALAEKKNGVSVAEIIRPYQRRPESPPVIVGYGRPVATGDERVVAMSRVADELGFEIGEHLALARQIEEEIGRRFHESMNLAGHMTAFLCDQGLTAEEIYRLSAIIVASGVLSCYGEAVENPAEAFFPLQCQDMDYQGPAPRPVPPRGN